MLYQADPARAYELGVSCNRYWGVAVPVSTPEPLILDAIWKVVLERSELRTGNARPLKAVVVVKPERVISSPAVKELDAVKVTIPLVPDHDVIDAAVPAGAGKLAVPFSVKQAWFEVKSNG